MLWGVNPVLGALVLRYIPEGYPLSNFTTLMKLRERQRCKLWLDPIKTLFVRRGRSR